MCGCTQSSEREAVPESEKFSFWFEIFLLFFQPSTCTQSTNTTAHSQQSLNYRVGGMMMMWRKQEREFWYKGVDGCCIMNVEALV